MSSPSAQESLVRRSPRVLRILKRSPPPCPPPLQDEDEEKVRVCVPSSAKLARLSASGVLSVANAPKHFTLDIVPKTDEGDQEDYDQDQDWGQDRGQDGYQDQNHDGDQDWLPEDEEGGVKEEENVDYDPGDFVEVEVGEEKGRYEDFPFFCIMDDCGYGAEDEGELRRHEKEEHFGWAIEACQGGKTGSCLRCEFTDTNPRVLLEHYKIKHTSHVFSVSQGKYERKRRRPKVAKQKALSRSKKGPKGRQQPSFSCEHSLSDDSGERCPFSTDSKREYHLHLHQEHGVIRQRARPVEKRLCPRCGKAIRYPMRHMREAHGILLCFFWLDTGRKRCWFETDSQEALERHRNAEHPNRTHPNRSRSDQASEGGMCPHCGKTFAHLKLHTCALGTSMRCQRQGCDFSTGSLARLCLHTRMWHKEACPRCCLPIDPRESDKWTTMDGHNKEVQQRRHDCPVDVVGDVKSEIVAEHHVQQFHELGSAKGKKRRTQTGAMFSKTHDGKFVCSQCTFSHGTKVHIKRHFHLMHRPQGCPLQPQCPHESRNRLEMVAHLSACHPELCPTCSFPKGDGSDSHDCADNLFHGGNRLVAHLPFRIRPLRCKFCRWCCDSYFNLWIHVKKYHGQALRLESVYPDDEVA